MRRGLPQDGPCSILGIRSHLGERVPVYIREVSADLLAHCERKRQKSLIWRVVPSNDLPSLSIRGRKEVEKHTGRNT
jgi:hypothetical protein